MFKNSVKLFELFGFQIRVDSSWLLIAALIVWSLTVAYFPQQLPGKSQYDYIALSVLAAIGLFSSLILHELAHSLVARHFGLKVGGITLFVFGGVAELEQEPSSPKSEFWIAVAGPVASFALSALFYLTIVALDGNGASKPLHVVFVYLGFVNLVLAIFNLVPAFPLDGGRILRAALWHLKGDVFEATRIASGFGTVFGIFLIVSGVLSLFTASSVAGLWQILIGFFIVSGSRSSYQQLIIKAALKEQTISALMTHSPIAADVDNTLDVTVNDIMLAQNVSFVPVLEGNHLLGYVDASLVREIERDNWPTTRLGDIMVAGGPDNTVSVDMPVDELFEKMVRTNRRKMLVGHAGRLDGVISLSDLLAYLAVLQGLGVARIEELKGRSHA
ncbi:site-2 protease family protein [Hoeflea prorocentri]|uniref:Zinc metalloprotease n=1 Tax=Hoeflea prorocentri TaxID=1922333 RepID=A0A9X3ZFZ8_9HYPH|nr:site-2 protease family protein [Hoeflea prorocentri]MCY6379664.1 site-2 protease family protein [Hoeflea prorocentri]MDA5397464.1 site-2 protease family protein [Hoeflea prorocentri]